MAKRAIVVETGELAERLLRTYSGASLTAKAKRFNYAAGDLLADARIWDLFRARGLMTLSELIALSRWKTGGRQDRNIEKNSDAAVRAVTTAATSVAGQVPDEPALPIGILTSLHGVDIPTASTVMTVWKPERFGILDIRAWNVLREVAPAEFPSVQSAAGNRRLFKLAEADLYLRLLREIAQRASLSCRAVDQALWMLGSRNER